MTTDLTLCEIDKLLKIDFKSIEKITNYLKLLDFKDDSAFIALNICNLDILHEFDNIIKNTIVEKDFPKQTRFNLKDLCESKGININAHLFKYLLHLKAKHDKPVGKGEALLRILMKGTISDDHGDFGASGKQFEIKFNNARLRGRYGFALKDASQVSLELDNLFIQECDVLNFNARPLIGILPNRWNFISGKNKNKTYLLSNIIKQSKMDPRHACILFVKAFEKYYKISDIERNDLVETLSAEFEEYDLKNNINGYSNFIYKMASFSMKYYANVERFDGLIVINGKNDAIYLTFDFINLSSLESLSIFIKNNFRITTPNLGEKAAEQGSSFGITLLSK